MLTENEKNERNDLKVIAYNLYGDTKYPVYKELVLLKSKNQSNEKWVQERLKFLAAKSLE